MSEAAFSLADQATLRAENEELRIQLDEAQQTLNAIRTGAVDAIVISGPEGENVFTLESSDRNYRLLIESIGEGALTANYDGSILYCNSKFAQIVSEPGETIIGRHITDFVAPENTAAFEFFCQGPFNNTEKHEVTFLKKGGIGVSAQVSICDLDSNGSHQMGMIITDLTQTKMAAQLVRANEHLTQNASDLELAQIAGLASAEALKESEVRFRSLANSIPQLSWMAKPDGHIYWYNERWFDYTGTNLTEMEGWGWAKVHHPDHVDRVVGEVKLAWQKGEAFEMTFPLRNKNGEFRWFLTRAVPIRDSGGRLVDWFGTNTDIDDQKRTEEELSRSNAELAHFAFVASHDLKEPLRVVTSYVQMLQLACRGKLDDKSLTYIKYITDAVTRMYAMINDLLSYSHIGAAEQQFESIDSSKVVSDALANLEAAILESRAEISVAPLPQIVADRAQMLQLFQNLISNAIKYRSDKVPTIAIDAKKGAGNWTFGIKDNGIGIEPQFFDKIFVLFQRLHGKEEYSGTGIGLAVCKRIVERLDGKMWVESELGKGSTFYFSIPDRAEKR